MSEQQKKLPNPLANFCCDQSCKDVVIQLLEKLLKVFPSSQEEDDIAVFSNFDSGESCFFNIDRSDYTARESKHKGNENPSHTNFSFSLFCGLKSQNLELCNALKTGSPAVLVFPYNHKIKNIVHLEYALRIDIQGSLIGDTNGTTLVANQLKHMSDETLSQVKNSLNEIALEVKTNSDTAQPLKLKAENTQPFLSNSERVLAASAINTLKLRMKSGLCYLANHTIRKNINRRHFKISPVDFAFEMFENPSRFGWYLKRKELQLESHSPERFLNLSGKNLQTEPIKGTAQLGPDFGLSKAAEFLWNSKKERAEQHLVTDLLRNDLGAIAEVGSVHVESPFEVRKERSLAQMTTTVTGTLSDTCQNEGVLDALHRMLPAGSVTGTPKKIVTKFTEELEQQDRGYYCGVCVDYKSECSLEATLLIRSLFKEKNSEPYVGVGAGITLLSNTEEEVEELELKLRSFLSPPCKQKVAQGDSL